MISAFISATATLLPEVPAAELLYIVVGVADGACHPLECKQSLCLQFSPQELVIPSYCEMQRTGLCSLSFRECKYARMNTKPGRVRRLTIVQSGTNWDPEGLLGAPQTGHINRRMMERQIQKDQNLAQAVKMTKDQARKELLVMREARRQPTTDAELIEYLLNTEAPDMKFEVARCHPKLTKEFFRYLDKVVGEERFSAKPDTEKLSELEALRNYLTAAVEAVEKTAKSTATAADRLKKLLTAQDKKECILQMAADNEIDQGLIDLLQQNIVAARTAGQEEPAKFMEKVLVATVKYLVNVV